MCSILVVEDDEAIRSALVEALDDEGYVTSCSSTGTRALQHLKESAVDVVLVDVFMPTMTGPDMVETMRRGGDHTPIIMMSAQPEQALPADVTFLRKPFDLERLFEVIERAIAS